MSGIISTAKPVDGHNEQNGSAIKPVHVFVQLRAMPNVPDNWDGHDGAAPQRNAIDDATAFLQLLAAYEIGCRLLPSAQASPTRTGGILIDWENGSRSLEIEFGPSEPEYLFYDRASDQAKTHTLDSPDSIPVEFLEYAAQIAG